MKTKHHFFPGGVHPKEDGKSLTSNLPIQTPPLLDQYYVLFGQHIGAPAKPIVQKGDSVLKGQPIAEAFGFISSPVHSPTSGKIKDITTWMAPTGMIAPVAIIESDGEDKAWEGMPPIENPFNNPPEILKERIADAGIVGMGGAAFPTKVKLSPPPNATIDTLIINGAECEPYLTADHRLMLEKPEKIIQGALLVKHLLNIKNVYIGIEENKSDAIKTLLGHAKEEINVESLRVHYPQGAEKQLIYSLTGRKVPTGGLPMEVGCVVQNVGTIVAIYDAIVEGKPLFERVTTVTGHPLISPSNWLLKVGTLLKDALTFCGGVKENPGKIIFGGPMMGMSQLSLDAPIMKNTSGILLLTKSEVDQFTSDACISCGNCVDVCTMNLIPSTLSKQIEKERFDLAEAWHIMDCIECGCCAYMCPSKRPLVHHFKKAKTSIVAKRKGKK